MKVLILCLLLCVGFKVEAQSWQNDFDKEIIFLLASKRSYEEHQQLFGKQKISKESLEKAHQKYLDKVSQIKRDSLKFKQYFKEAATNQDIIEHIPSKYLYNYYPPSILTLDDAKSSINRADLYKLVEKHLIDKNEGYLPINLSK